MTEYAILDEGQLVGFRHLDQVPVLEGKAYRVFLPVVRDYGDPFEGVDGEVYRITTVDPATLPAPVPVSVSDRQFFHAAAIAQMITQAEALAAVRTGDIPAELQTIVDAIEDDDARFNAQMFLSGAVEFRRDHPLTEAIRIARGMTSEQVDDLFRLAGSL